MSGIVSNFELTILGCNSAIQAFGRHPTSQVFSAYNQLYLIDCGEGAQFQLDKFHIKKSRINQIFISHLHGDHYYGLMGLLSSYRLHGRTEPLQVFCPIGTKEIVEVNLKHSKGQFVYPIEFYEIEDKPSHKIFEDKYIEVHTIPLNHKIATTGFLFVEKPRERNFIKEKIEEYQIPNEVINLIKEGNDFIGLDGKVISYTELTTAPHPQRKYAYCSDTIYDESILPIIQGVDLLYHEATYLHTEELKAQQYWHSTAKQAATIALKANAQCLMIGHYSSRYDNLDELLNEAKSVFSNSMLAIEGRTTEVSPTAP